MDVRGIGYGTLAGLAGGLVFGAMMHAMGMIAMVGGLIGMKGVAAGWAVHLVNSAIIGAIYGATLGQAAHSAGRGGGYGLLYGAAWWVLGPLLIMPLWMGMPVFQVGEMQLLSLVGHLTWPTVSSPAWPSTASCSRRPRGSRSPPERLALGRCSRGTRSRSSQRRRHSSSARLNSSYAPGPLRRRLS
ncbi:MAG TPA: hypothetical protein VM324_00945 [Egibacteraceae bacterium]|jgi:hypothetical protein|nr:hypothetical protein [Egibacteraceae bacterium]